jgi:AcrR family transcriptional regulator
MSPRSEKDNERIRAESSGKILDAALVLMAQHGYESASISQIAREAGVSKGLIYNYFSSKEDLLKALINRTMGDGENLLSETYSDTPAKTLEYMFRWFFNELRNNMDQWKFISEIMMKADKYTFVKELVTIKMREYIKLFSGLLAEMGFEQPTQEAYVIGGLFDGIGFQCLIVGKAYPIDEMEQYLIEKYCKAL